MAAPLPCSPGVANSSAALAEWLDQHRMPESQEHAGLSLIRVGRMHCNQNRKGLDTCMYHTQLKTKQSHPHPGAPRRTDLATLSPITPSTRHRHNTYGRHLGI